MPRILAISIMLCTTPAHARDVTSQTERRKSLIEYLTSRDDLEAKERQRWLTAVRRAFGGKALNDGNDEGVTGAKSVIAAAIFHGIDATYAARAALAAYHDIARFVPPPIAVQYQVLAFSGRKPTASPRQMAFDFPRYFNEDIAQELVRFWDTMLATDRIPKLDRPAVIRALNETRKKMRPMLRERLWQAVVTDARHKVTRVSKTEQELFRRTLDEELARDFEGVLDSEASLREARSLYERYAAACAELGEKPKENPSAQAETKTRASAASSPTALPRAPEAWPSPLTVTISRWLGTPYRYGGTDRNGIDCSAFTRAVMQESVRLALPRSSVLQYGEGVAVAQKTLLPGDLVFFDTLDRGRITHVTIFVGDGRIAHASSSKGVSYAELALPYYQRAYVGARRVLEQ